MIESIVGNEFKKTKDNVFVLSDGEFGYSDGAYSEKYFNHIFNIANDLSSDSAELEGYIFDWTTEYHLTSKRADLLRGFEFDKSSDVLEVGCGCGAITRYLGENFKSVVSVEGSYERAKIARLRTHDQDNVSIINSPFQDVVFTKKFDVIFCIGVFEYSSVFVESDDPYNSILDYFNSLLSENGVLVLAIENKFGIKYFSSSSEDHTRVMFDGIEGYPSYANKAKTFGYHELSKMMSEHFDCSCTYFPYPDYKLPECVLSQDSLEIEGVSELISRYKSRDYSTDRGALFDESMVNNELYKNNMLHFFANSFLILAGKGSCKLSDLFPQKGIFYSRGRRQEHQTTSRIVCDNDSVLVEKLLLNNKSLCTSENDSVRHVLGSERWCSGNSLYSIMKCNVRKKDISFKESILPIVLLHKKLTDVSENTCRNNYLPGDYIDLTFSNVKINGAQICIFDKEWIWKENINLDSILLRAIFHFLCEIRSDKRILRKYKRPVLFVVKPIFSELNIKLTYVVFRDFIEIEDRLRRITDIPTNKIITYAKVVVILIAPISYISFILRFKNLLSRIKKIKFKIIWKYFK